MMYANILPLTLMARKLVNFALLKSMKALLALLSHGIDGNAIDPMKEAKAALESYLIDGQNLKDI